MPGYTIKYNANGGSNAPNSQTKTQWKDLTLRTAKPTRTGYTFQGWATTSAKANAGTVDYKAGAVYKSNSKVTLYAVWKKSPTTTPPTTTPTPTSHIPGRILDNNKAPCVFDALEILSFVTGLPNAISKAGAGSREWNAAIIAQPRKSSEPDIFDALEVLSYVVGLPSRCK